MFIYNQWWYLKNSVNKSIQNNYGLLKLVSCTLSGNSIHFIRSLTYYEPKNSGPKTDPSRISLTICIFNNYLLRTICKKWKTLTKITKQSVIRSDKTMFVNQSSTRDSIEILFYNRLVVVDNVCGLPANGTHYITVLR